MIKVEKEYIKIDGKETTVLAEYMSITAYLSKLFGPNLILDLIEGALEEIGEIEKGE